MHPTSLGEAAARNLADVSKTLPQMGALSPRWLLRMLPWADVTSGIYRVNRVRVVGSEFERMETRATVRPSLGLYNTPDDLDRLGAALRSLR